MTSKLTFTSTPDNGYGSNKVEHILTVRGGRGSLCRFGVGFVPEGSEARQVHQGPMVPGPWAYTYGLCSVIDCHGGTGAERKRNLAAGTEHDVEDGDKVEIDGVQFAVKVTCQGADRRVKLVVAE